MKRTYPKIYLRCRVSEKKVACVSCKNRFRYACALVLRSILARGSYAPGRHSLPVVNKPLTKFEIPKLELEFPPTCQPHHIIRVDSFLDGTQARQIIAIHVL